MIKYPFLEKNSTIGVTAPSSGVPRELHELLQKAMTRMETKGYHVSSRDTAWTQYKATSASAKKRAKEFNQLMKEEEVQLIFPPWGGNLLIEILEFIDFENLHPKWILGYSDTSLLLLAVTLKTGIATAHGTNLIDVRGDYSDKTTAAWEAVLSTKKGESISQYSSEKYQKEWDFDQPTPCVFNLTEETYWKTISGEPVRIQGRLLGGCIDTIRHLVGTSFGEVQTFKNKYLNGSPIIWFFENCDLDVVDLRRSLIQMKLAGWFDNCSGMMFGRSDANHSVDNYTIEDVYEELSKELQVPIIFDVDCGHVPPQLTLINGAYAEIEVAHGRGAVIQKFI